MDAGRVSHLLIEAALPICRTLQPALLLWWLRGFHHFVIFRLVAKRTRMNQRRDMAMWRQC